MPARIDLGMYVFNVALIHDVSLKRHPFCFFYNSVDWRSICMNFLPDVGEKIKIQII